MFYWTSKSKILVEKGTFLSSRISEKGVFFKLGYEHGCTLWSGVAGPRGDVWAVWGVHDGVIKWIHFPRYWPFVREIHRSPVNSPHKGQWRGALMSSLICAWINGWVNSGEAGDLRRHRAHYDVTLMRFEIYGMVEMWYDRERGKPKYWSIKRELERRPESIPDKFLTGARVYRAARGPFQYKEHLSRYG